MTGVRKGHWLLSVPLLAFGPLPIFAQDTGVAGLQWLAGCWESRADGMIIEEHWMAPAGGILLGVGRTQRDASLVGYEFMQIYGRGDSLVFAAHPSGQDPAEFLAPEAGDREVVFENPAHDFPQRVRYRASGTDSLAARVEGVRGEELEGVDFYYERIACPGSGNVRNRE